MYTVKQLADLAGVSRRTLHFYDQIGLLKPELVRENGYRLYGEAALLRLQQILFFRELDLGLVEIGKLLDDPGFDTLEALLAHHEALLARQQRLDRLIATVDDTMAMLKGERVMDDERLFEVWSDEKSKELQEEAAQRWGEKARESQRLWHSYSPEKRAQIGAEGEANYREMLAHMSEGPASPAVQAALAKWHEHMRYFYEPTMEILEGLGHHYNEDPRFHATFAKLHPDFPAFLEQAITIYVSELK